MLQFSKAPQSYREVGVLFLLAQLSVVWLKTEPFQYGIWFQLEPITLGLLALSAANALWLAVGFQKRWLAFVRPFHPLFIVMTAFVMWQWVATFFAPFPWRSWFGHPSVGEGAAFYTAMIMSVLMTSALWRDTYYQKIILTFAGCTMTVLSLSYINLDNICRLLPMTYSEEVAAKDWPDYLIFMVGYFWLAFMASNRVQTPTRYAWVVLISVFIIYGISDSHTGQFLFRFVFVFGGLLLYFHLKERPKWLVPNRYWRYLAVAGCSFSLLWVAISTLPRWINCLDTTLAMRAGFNLVSLAAFEHEPWRLFMGSGFASYPDALFKYSMVDGVYAFNRGVWTNNWTMLFGTAYHSHNQAMEMVLSLGIPGLLLWLAMPVCIILTMPRQRFWWCVPMVVGISVIQGFWFCLPQVMAYQVISWVALSSGWRRQVQSSLEPLSLRWVSIIFLILAAVMTWSATSWWQAMDYGQKLQVAMISEPVESFPIERLAADMERGGDRLRDRMWDYGKWMNNRVIEGVVTPRDVAWYKRFMEVANVTAKAPNAGAWVVSGDLLIDNMLGLMDDKNGELKSLKSYAKETMPDVVLALTRAAPLREDFAAQFLFSLDIFTKGDTKRAKEILQKILDIAPNHRSALWLMGRELMKDPQRKTEGLAMIKRAIALGVDRVYPVTRAELNEYANEY